MTIAAVREKLREYIDHADDKKLKAIYTLVENEIEEDIVLSEDEMKEMDRRWDNYILGKSKLYTVEESEEHIKNYRSARKKNAL